MRRSTKAGAVIEAILILAGLALLAKTFAVATTTYKFLGNTESTEGIVNAIEDGGLTLIIQYSDNGNAGAVISQTGLLFGHEVGDHVPVLYDRDNPAQAAMDDPRALWFKPLALTAGAFLFLFLGFRLRAGRNL